MPFLIPSEQVCFNARMTMRRFEMIEGSSAKFWDVDVRGKTLTVKFGRIGTDGQSKAKNFASSAEAELEAGKLVREKTKKGYAEIGKSSKTATRGTKGTKEAKASASAAPAVKTQNKSKANPRQLEADECDIVLSSWAGYRTSPKSKPSTGEVLVAIGGDAGIVDEYEVGKAEQAAYAGVLKSETAIQEAILDAIASRVPEATDPKNQIVLSQIHIHLVKRGGVAYVGYQFNCEWDREHGLGVMMHGTRVVEVGQADTAILAWIAERDATSGGKKAKANPRELEIDAVSGVFVELSAWAGYRTNPKHRLSSGTILIENLYGASDDYVVGKAEQAAYAHLIGSEVDVQEAILSAIAAKYPDPKNQIELQSIHIHLVERDGAAYVGYQFECEGELEDGLGVMMHGTRVVAIGDCWTAINATAAEKDSKPAKARKGADVPAKKLVAGRTVSTGTPKPRKSRRSISKKSAPSKSSTKTKRITK